MRRLDGGGKRTRMDVLRGSNSKQAPLVLVHPGRGIHFFRACRERLRRSRLRRPTPTPRAYDSRGQLLIMTQPSASTQIRHPRLMAAGLPNGATAVAPAAIAISTQPKTFGPISSTSSFWYAVR